MFSSGSFKRWKSSMKYIRHCHLLLNWNYTCSFHTHSVCIIHLHAFSVCFRWINLKTFRFHPSSLLSPVSSPEVLYCSWYVVRTARPLRQNALPVFPYQLFFSSKWTHFPNGEFHAGSNSWKYFHLYQRLHVANREKISLAVQAVFNSVDRRWHVTFKFNIKIE